MEIKISKTRIEKRMKHKMDASLVGAIITLKKTNPVIAKELARPKRRWPAVNLKDVDMIKGDVLVAGKILSAGELRLLRRRRRNRMGDIKRKRKLFSRPKKLFDRARMDEENVLIKRYGLKNKREIWKAKTAVSKLRRRAKALIGKDIKEQQKFFDKLNKMGIAVTDVSDVLALTEEDLFERRLQTMIVKKKLATTAKGARQLIVHKNVLVDGKVVNIPSFVVTTELEDKITLKEKKVKAKPKPEVPTEEVPVESEVTEEVTEGAEKTDETKEEVSTEEEKTEEVKE